MGKAPRTLLGGDYLHVLREESIMSESEQLRAAVVGLGGMGRRHIQAIQAIGIEVIAICDLNENAFPLTLELCKTIPRTYTQWQTLLEKEATHLAVLVVATNGPTHSVITQTAAQAGIKYMLCEKPMATNGHDAREMVAACKRAGSRLAIHLTQHFTECYIRLKELLKTGIIGELQHFGATVGAGGLGCAGTHFFDFPAWIADTTPVWVVGTVDPNLARNVRGPQFFDPGGRGMVGYANGLTGSFQLSGDIPYVPRMEIVGTQGFVEIDEWWDPNVRIEIWTRPIEHWTALKTQRVKPERVEFGEYGGIDMIRSSQVCLRDLLGEHREDTVSGGIAAVDIVMAFHLSAKRDMARVRLPLTGPDLLFDVPIT